MHGEQACVGARRDRFSEQRTVHGSVAARLEHQALAETVAVPAQPCELPGHRPAGDRRRASHEQPDRLAGHVRVNRADLLQL
jgi:hypothetical protein